MPGRKKMGTGYKRPSGWARPLKNQGPSSRVDSVWALGYNGINKRIIMIEYKDLKKKDEVRTTQLGTPITGKLLESPKQGRGLKRTILIQSNGSEIGMFDEAGSVYAHQVTEVRRDGDWQQVKGQPQ